MMNNKLGGGNKGSLLDIINRESALVARLFAVFVICYGYELSNFNLSIDEERVSANGTEWLVIGRWALQWITAVFWPTPTTPFGPFILFGVLSSASYAVLLHTFNVKQSRLVHYSLFPVFIAFPVWFNQVEFSANIIGCGVGLLFTSLAVNQTKQLFSKDYRLDSLRRLLPAILLLQAFVVGIYQSFIFLYIVLTVAVFLYRFITEDDVKVFFIRIVGVGSIAVGAFLLSSLISKSAMLLYGLSAHQYGESFLQFDRLLNEPLAVLKNTANQIAGVYGLYWSDFGGAEYVFLALPVIGGVLLAIKTINRGRLISHAAVWLTVVFIVLVPFSLNPFMGGELPVRTFIAVPAVVWLFLFLPLILYRSERVELFILIVSLFTSIHILFIQSSIQAKAWTVRQHDILLAESIYKSIVDINAGQADGGRIKVAFWGYKSPADNPYPLVYSSTSGASFFEWDGGNDYRIIAFMKLIGLSHLSTIDKQDCFRIMPEAGTMADWPASGSVKRIGDITLVKLSGGNPPVICR